MPRPPHALVIDNYDSFTYNLVQALLTLGADVAVRRNNAVTLGDIHALDPTHIVISPGPGAPREAGVSTEVIRELGGRGRCAILGVCLGHQAMSEAFGGRVVRSGRPMHGKPSQVRHDGRGVFRGLPSPLQAGRYHSLIVRPEDMPPGFVVTARTDDGEIMGMRHPTFPVEGVQFHPESILTPEGGRMLANFLAMRPPSSPEPSSVSSADAH